MSEILWKFNVSVRGTLKVFYAIFLKIFKFSWTMQFS